MVEIVEPCRYSVWEMYRNVAIARTAVRKGLAILVRKESKVKSKVWGITESAACWYKKTKSRKMLRKPRPES